jgi:biotin transport system substrate-specific component
VQMQYKQKVPQVDMESRTFPVMADSLLKGRVRSSVLTDAALISLFAVVTAGSAQISIPLPFTPVPLTLQNFAVLLTGAALGARRGMLSMALYLVIGALGAPAFAGGAHGADRLLCPSGGYLLSYPFVAALIGVLAARGWDRSRLKMTAAMLVGSMAIYTCGVLWLSRFVGGVGPAIVKGMLPFIPGDLLKVAAASFLIPGAWTMVNRVQDKRSQ